MDGLERGESYISLVWRPLTVELARRLADRHQYLLERLEEDVMKGDINADAMEKRLEILDAVFKEANTIYAGLDEESCPPPEMPKEAVITVSLRDIETRNTGDSVVSSSNSCVVEEEEALPYGFELRQIQKMKSLAYQKQWGMAVEQLPSDQLPPSNKNHTLGRRWHCQVRLWIDAKGNVTFGNCSEDYHTRDNLIRHIFEVHLGKERLKST